MSQEKVNSYKEEKRNRKKIMAQEKRMHYARTACGCLIAAALVGWAGFSVYNIYQDRKPIETVYADLSAISEYEQSLVADTEE